MQPNGNGDGQIVDYQDVHPAVINPMDASPATFRAGLDRRKANRNTLMEWIRSSLVEGRDYGSIMIKGLRSKPTLLKAGSEKIIAMLGLIARFPNLKEYEDAVLDGKTLTYIILKCELHNQIGEVIGEGVGARSIEIQDNGDLNKSLKMSAKSAMIDATLRCAGISEIFTQDIEELPNYNPDHVETPHQMSPKSSELASEKQVAAVRALIVNPKVYPSEKRQIHEWIEDGLLRSKAKELLDYYYGISVLVEGAWTKTGHGELDRR
ncbi:MAG: hypothetical protein HOE44_10910 [Candidatus Marinimicrobia bacterium]|nr:hypothetical protein [Candidatus Neomarinimicrobiota bacterium]